MALSMNLEGFDTEDREICERVFGGLKGITTVRAQARGFLDGLLEDGHAFIVLAPGDMTRYEIAVMTIVGPQGMGYVVSLPNFHGSLTLWSTPLNEIDPWYLDGKLDGNRHYTCVIVAFFLRCVGLLQRGEW